MLAGVPNIIMGFRDDDGQLKHLNNYPTHSIPDLCKKHGANWNPLVCFQFAHACFSFLFSNVHENKTYIFEFDPKKKTLKLEQNDTNIVAFSDLEWMKNISISNDSNGVHFTL